jgi:hypothetical protein
MADMIIVSIVSPEFQKPLLLSLIEVITDSNAYKTISEEEICICLWE